MELDPNDPLIPLPWQSESIKAYRAQKAMEAQTKALQQEKLRYEVEKLRMEDPNYAAQVAGDLGAASEQGERDLSAIRETLGDVQKTRGNIVSASTPLGQDVSGPVIPQDIAKNQITRSLELEGSLRLEEARKRNILEYLRKQQEGLIGTVPLPEGMGTAPAGQYASVYQRRASELVPLTVAAMRDVDNTQDPVERNAKIGVYSQMKSVSDSITRKTIENSLKVPGLEGMAPTEKSANEMRKIVSDFSSSVRNIDELIKLGENVTPVNYLQRSARAEALRSAITGQLRVIMGGPGVMSDTDLKLMREIIENPVDITSPNAEARLYQLKAALARNVASSAGANGFTLRKISDVLNVGGEPEDIEEFSKPKQKNTFVNFQSEQAARVAGKKDDDIVIIGGKQYRLAP